jgi:4-hydroxybenzoate polyprenyltransferase
MTQPVRKGIKSVISFLVFSNILTSVAAATPTLLAFFLLGYPVTWPVWLVVFSGTLLIYTLNRFTDIPEDTINLPGRVEFIYRYGKTNLIVAVIVYVCSLAMVAVHNIFTGIVGILPLIIAVSYSCLRLKKFFLVKNILISTGCTFSVLIVGANFNDFSIRTFLLAIIT